MHLIVSPSSIKSNIVGFSRGLELFLPVCASIVPLPQPVLIYRHLILLLLCSCFIISTGSVIWKIASKVFCFYHTWIMFVSIWPPSRITSTWSPSYFFPFCTFLLLHRRFSLLIYIFFLALSSTLFLSPGYTPSLWIVFYSFLVNCVFISCLQMSHFSHSPSVAAFLIHWIWKVCLVIEMFLRIEQRWASEMMKQAGLSTKPVFPVRMRVMEKWEKIYQREQKGRYKRQKLNLRSPLWTLSGWSCLTFCWSEKQTKKEVNVHKKMSVEKHAMQCWILGKESVKLISYSCHPAPKREISQGET